MSGKVLSLALSKALRTWALAEHSRSQTHLPRLGQTLSTNPTRCPLAPENDLIDQSVYQYFYGKRAARYRVLFTIEEDRVLVLHIRRGTMDKAAESDLLGC